MRKKDLGTLKRGEGIVMEWLDASIVYDIRRLTSRTVAAVKTSVGWFDGIVKDRKYRVEHLCLKTEKTDGGVFDILSVPLANVVSLRKIRASEMPAIRRHIRRTEQMLFERGRRDIA